jgi:hypothetical protein
MRQGSCLCEGVRFEISGDLANPIACHCSQCARTSGNFAVMTACNPDDLHLVTDTTLAWFRSSEAARRGFCSRCGGNLFWKPDSGDLVYIAMGTIHAPTGLEVAEHIFVGSKSDFYDICDGKPQNAEW